MKNQNYFFNICDAVAKKSKCLSRQIGCVIVKENAILSTGYNGPPRNYEHCKDNCPRTLNIGYKSGKFLEQCPAVHAEANAITQAARNGTCINNATLYLNTVLPCKSCMGLIINAGIKEIHCLFNDDYDEMASKMAAQCNIKIYRKV